MTNLYFAYGANINIWDMEIRCPNARPVGAFELRDWQLELYSHATIQPNPGQSVHGVLWDLTPECEQALDRFEGWPIYYTKREWTQDGKTFFFYEMVDPRSGRPHRDYIMGIADGYLHWHLPVQRISDALDRAYDPQRQDLQPIGW